MRKIQFFFGVGKIATDDKNDLVFYTVNSIIDLTNVIIPHFLNNPLLTHKQADFLLFKLAVDSINCKQHLNIEGLRKIVEIKASINKGLNVTLIEAFPDIVPVNRPKVILPSTIDPNWLVGFTDGEGCFNINIISSKTHKIGTQVKVRFILPQHSRDLDLMRKLVQFLGAVF